MSTELRETVTICNQRGLHARASAKFVGAVAKLRERLFDTLKFRIRLAGAVPQIVVFHKPFSFSA